MNILTVVGARPQFVKASAVSRALKQRGITETLVHTGQHYDGNMSQIFFDELDMRPPDHQLGVGGGLHGDMTGRLLIALEPLLVARKPDMLLVYGDTNSTLAGALAASKLHVPVAHIEAGLRSFNRRMPEEINRVVTDHLSAHLYCPTTTAVQNLSSEGIIRNVSLVGDVMFDVSLGAAPRALRSDALMNRLGLESDAFILATIHRQENADHPTRLRRILDALAHTSQRLPVVLPLHPRTRKRMLELGLDYQAHPHFHLVDPLGYLEMNLLEQKAAVVVTDSGGVQKEAYFFRVPCVTLRDETEWVELVELGWNTLVDVESADISWIIEGAIGSRGRTDVHPYGVGNASELIADDLLAHLQ